LASVVAVLAAQADSELLGAKKERQAAAHAVHEQKAVRQAAAVRVMAAADMEAEVLKAAADMAAVAVPTNLTLAAGIPATEAKAKATKRNRKSHSFPSPRR
jgi:hypothetical protein